MIKNLRNSVFSLSLKQKMILFIGTAAVMVPMVLVSLLASIYYYLGIESIFSNQIRSTFKETVRISEIYLEEHVNEIRPALLSLANDIRYNLSLIRDLRAFNKFLDDRANALSLSEAVVFNENIVLAKTSLSFSLMFEKVPLAALDKSKNGDIYIERIGDGNKVRAIMKLDSALYDFMGENLYLLVGKTIDNEITQHLVDSQKLADTYISLEQNIVKIRHKVVSAFIGLTLVLWLLSLIFANKLAILITNPINQLVKAAIKVKEGDLSVRVSESNSNDEISILAITFNQMTSKIDEQHSKLKHANYIIDERRRFIETILSELSAGVITLDREKKIVLCNNSALNLLKVAKNDKELDLQSIKGLTYNEVFPELDIVISKLNNDFFKIDKDTLLNNNLTQNIEVQIGNFKRNLFVRAAVVFNDNKADSIIVTFDDISELVTAQRFKAWADIARRIAHEIKNPLTPIQLSTERLRKKFIPQIHEDAEQFSRYLDTISRRVEDIRVMVGEFVEFSKISIPKIKSYDLCLIIKEIIFFQQTAYPEIEYRFDNCDKCCYVECDRMQITQVLLNLFKNSAEAISAKTNIVSSIKGIISITLEILTNHQKVQIKVQDNGKGIEEDLLNKIYEPYITTKNNGMGLGLSIVKKIIEEHGEKFSISNTKLGACAVFNLTLTTKQKE